MSRTGNAMRAERIKLWSKKSAIWWIGGTMLLAMAVTIICLFLRGTGAEQNIPLLGGLHGIEGLADTDCSDDWKTPLRERTAELVVIRQNAEYTLDNADGIKAGQADRIRAKALWEESVKRYYIEKDKAPQGDNPWQVVILALWLIIPVIAVVSAVYASDMFAGEFERNTIRLIFSRPMTRSRLFRAKIMNALGYSAILTAAAFAASAAVSFVFFDDNITDTYVGFRNGEVYTTTWLRQAMLMLLCGFVMIAVGVFLCAFVGSFTHSRGVSVAAVGVLMAGSYFGGELLGSLGSRIVGLNIFTCLDLTTAAAGLPDCTDMSLWMCLLSVAAHSALFLSLGYRSFRRDV